MSRCCCLVALLMFVGCGGSGGGEGNGADSGPPPASVDAGPPRPDARGAVCGDGVREGDEECDDGDTESGDGCSDKCILEANFACPAQNEECVQIVVCGNGRIEGEETCDDRNTTAGDGCSDLCQAEDGWSCPVAGVACVATECGDGIVAGFEACDDGGAAAPGCTDECQLEPGFHCPAQGQDCLPTACGDMLVQGLEECDDGNQDIGDGCTPLCTREPNCANGVCDAVCGDGVVWAPEECDDGNTANGDGCSATCIEEAGFECVEVPLPPPPVAEIPITIRDFINSCGDDSRPLDTAQGASAPFGHPDFQCFNSAGSGMVASTLGVNGKPTRVSNTHTSSDAAFDQWYVTDSDYNKAISTVMSLPVIPGGAYRFDSESFFPATGLGWDVEDCDPEPTVFAACESLHNDGNGSGDRNFYFTSEARWWFEFAGDELLEFSGDDDVWVFINGNLAVDIGGVHGREDGSVDLSDTTVAANLGLTLGGIYEVVVFQAERRRVQSQYRLTLTNFTQAPSTCTDECGDGEVSSREVCDLGSANNGSGDGSDYGGCTTECTLEPFCGDGIIQGEFGEICDDGLNLGGEASACAPGCQSLGSVCGDNVVQTSIGEECDDGNTTAGDGCDENCKVEFIIE